MATYHFTCWAKEAGGTLRRIEVVASTEADARRLAFGSCPRAISVSCRSAGYSTKEQRHDN